MLEEVVQLAVRSTDAGVLKRAIDQAAELGFGDVFVCYFNSISHTDLSEGNIRHLKEISDYGKQKGILFGGYELMMASRGWGTPADNYNCIDPATKRPGSMFGQSACGASKWADMFYTNFFKLQAATGISVFGPDGPYHGDCCAATDHPHHKGLDDSQWAQWKWMCSVIHECQRRNMHVVMPDYYFLQGISGTGMGYRESTEGLETPLQMMLYRQYMFDGTFHKTANMGWVCCYTESLHRRHGKGRPATNTTSSPC